MKEFDSNSSNELEIKSEDYNNYTRTETNQPNINEKAELIEQNRENIRTIIKSSLQISGYLMTIVLGVVYFSYSESGKEIIPLGTKALVFVSSLCFPISIFMNIWTLRLKPKFEIETESQIIELNKTFKREKCWNNAAIAFLLLSVAGLIGGMIIFAVERTFDVVIFDQEQFLWLKDSTIFLCRFVCNNAKLSPNQLLWLKEFTDILYTIAYNLLKYNPYTIISPL